MPYNTFKKLVGASSPDEFRTPSPPVEFHEPISPSTPNPPSTRAVPRLTPYEHTESQYLHADDDGYSYTYSTYVERDMRKDGGLDTFASIALAAGDVAPSHGAAVIQKPSSIPYQRSRTWRNEREKYPTLNGHYRLSNSISQNPTKRRDVDETRRLEAELLLNFSREACFSIPAYSPTFRRPSTSQVNEANFLVSPRTPYSTPPQPQYSPIETQNAKFHASEPESHKRSSTSPTTHIAGPQEMSPEPSQSPRPTQDTTFSFHKPLIAPGQDLGAGLGLKGPDTWQFASPPKSSATWEPQSDLQQGEKMEVEEKQDVADGGGESIQEAREVTPTPAIAEMPTPNEQIDVTEGMLVEQSSTNDATPLQYDAQEEPVTATSAEIPKPTASVAKTKQADTPSICAFCNFSRNILPGDAETDSTSWISCDGCRKWFHFACAGFRSEREVRVIDKFRCKPCRPIHGATTYVRKSARAHSAIDYAGLHEGVIKTSDEDPEHHYVKDFKNGKKFTPETFARMRPELVTADFFRKGDGMKEPVLIPAEFNPRPRKIPDIDLPADLSDDGQIEQFLAESEVLHERSALDSQMAEQFEYRIVKDEGQDALDMVIPQDLTVRKVSELYGPDEKIEVIDVKSQNGEDKRWTMKRWVDYYESTGAKVVRNVISLEVSQSKLGRLIRRPKVVRDLDLQDAVWPSDLQAKGEFPKVQFYCLMSVADCYTDFHIDFGGSSVYYHILKGKKTFFFIPPHEKHLKKYEEWCNSPAQNWTFLGDQTKECYRVDLSEGDTMLIPAGWIHAVWTPEDSLVIGGNFLTPMHYPLQIRVAQIEKTTNVARKFRYPFFQKVLWYSAIHYLNEDPVPGSVVELLTSGQSFERPPHSVDDFDAWGSDPFPGAEKYQARYYPKAELEGLPDLCQYLYRTALIANGNLTEGISVETRNAVRRSIPKGHSHGEPLELIKKFAVWCTWKRGNEPLPYWAYPGYVPEGGVPEQTEKKISAKARRKLDREAAYQAFRVAPDRQSMRARVQPQNLLAEIIANQNANQSSKKTTPAPLGDATPILKRKASDLDLNNSSLEAGSLKVKKARPSTGQRTGQPRRPACDACRKSRRACKHRDDPLPTTGGTDTVHASITVSPSPNKVDGRNNSQTSPTSNEGKTLSMVRVEIVKPSQEQMRKSDGIAVVIGTPNKVSGVSETPQSKPQGRTRACKDCRRSKVSS